MHHRVAASQAASKIIKCTAAVAVADSVPDLLAGGVKFQAKKQRTGEHRSSSSSQTQILPVTKSRGNKRASGLASLTCLHHICGACAGRPSIAKTVNSHVFCGSNLAVAVEVLGVRYVLLSCGCGTNHHQLRADSLLLRS